MPPDGTGQIHGEFRKDLLSHLDACLAVCPIRISNYRSRLGRFQLSYAKFFQQTLLLIIRDQALNAGKCGYVYAERGRFGEATVYLSMVKVALVENLLINTRRNKIESKYIIAFLSSYVLYSRIIPLSYAWGDAIITRPILLNGVETTVTVHLDSDLRNLDLTGSERLL